MRILITTLTAFLLFSACKKDKNKNSDTPPPQTQNGANILSCKVDGVWHNYSGKSTMNHYDGVDYEIYGSAEGIYVRIRADKTEYNDVVMIKVYDEHPTLGKVYDLSSEALHTAIYTKVNAEYYTPLKSGQVIFTRCDDQVAAGTFYFTAVRNNDTIKITDGYFDIARSK